MATAVPEAHRDSPTPEAIEQILELLLSGQRQQPISDAIRKQFPGADPARYLSAALDHIEQFASPKPETIRGWCYLAYQRLYLLMTEAGDLQGALKAVKSLQDMTAK